MKYDIIVIGSGPGGYVAAVRAAQAGKRTAIVEREALGGVCLNWGCIPTKALLKSASVYHYVKNAASYGIDIEGEAKADISKIVARSRGVAETMSKGIDFLMKKNKIDVLRGHGSIESKGVVAVENEEGRTLYEADHIILATGARPRQMPFIPVDGEKIITSREALVIKELPKNLLIAIFVIGFMSSCSNGGDHFISDATQRAEVERDLQEKMAQLPNGDLFNILNSELPQKEKEALE